MELLKTLDKIAEDRNVPVAQVSLNWNTQKDFVTTSLCGVRNVILKQMKIFALFVVRNPSRTFQLKCIGVPIVKLQLYKQLINRMSGLVLFAEEKPNI